MNEQRPRIAKTFLRKENMCIGVCEWCWRGLALLNVKTHYKMCENSTGIEKLIGQDEKLPNISTYIYGSIHNEVAITWGKNTI